MATMTEERLSVADTPVAPAPLAAPAPAAGPGRRPRTAGPSWEQYPAAVLASGLTIALIFALMAFAAYANARPGAPLSGDRAAAGGGPPAKVAGAFSSEIVAQRVAVAAEPSGALKWDKATYEAQAGDITFQVSNRSVLPHNFAIEGNGVKIQSKDFGGNTDHVFTVKGLPAGEYLIVCTVPGHRESGMIAKLIVK